MKKLNKIEVSVNRAFRGISLCRMINLTQADTLITSSAHIDVAAIMFTSGTTGISKGCMLSHRFAMRTAENMVKPIRLTEHDINYTPYPLSHIGPAYYDILPMMLIGGQAVIRCWATPAPVPRAAFEKRFNLHVLP